jgi:hypothetical protein
MHTQYIYKTNTSSEATIIIITDLPLTYFMKTSTKEAVFSPGIYKNNSLNCM